MKTLIPDAARAVPAVVPVPAGDPGPRTYRMYVDGRWTDAVDGATYEVRDPATGELVALVPQGGVADAEAAVQAARRAFDAGPWRRTTAVDRARYLTAIAARLRERADELALLETRTMGKLLGDSLVDVNDAAHTFEFYAGLAMSQHGQTLEVPDDALSIVVREPVGVTAGITPWNYPLLMVAWKLAPSLAAGNVMILKPASVSPTTTLELAAITEEVGLPAGVVQVITGPGGEIGDHLARSPLVDMVAFTGSVEVGKHIMRVGADSVKKVGLELGGKSPNIVFSDADFEAAIDGALAAIFAGSGEVCSAGSRLLVERGIYDRFVGELVSRTMAIRVGSPTDEATEMGPLVAADQLRRVEDYVHIGLEEGARLATGGRRLDRPGYFYEPTVFVDVDNSMRIAQEEIFGPVLVAIPFDDEEEAVRLANDTVYGLAGAVWTRDISKAIRVLKRLRAGITWANTYHPTYSEAPWGGYKQSGFGRELGSFGLEEYQEVKQININLGTEPLGVFPAGRDREVRIEREEGAREQGARQLDARGPEAVTTGNSEVPLERRPFRRDEAGRGEWVAHCRRCV
jgi:betaine-aldehyde dehydrogenase